MERNQYTLLSNDKAYAIGSNHPMLDLRQGNSMGYGPDYTEILSSSVQIRRQVIPILLRAPTLFYSLPNPEYWIGTLKAIMEEGYQSLDGLKTGREYEFVSTPIGGAGEEMEDISNAKIPRSEVTYNFRDRYGYAFNRFWTGYGDMCMMHPETKYATINTTGNGPSDMLPDRYTFAMLFYEPDASMQYAVNAWVGEYMMPKNAGTIDGKRDMTQAGDAVELAIPFTGVYQSNTAGVLALAQSVIDGTSIVGANPNYRPPAQASLDAGVTAQATGWANTIEKFRSTAVKVL